MDPAIRGSLPPPEMMPDRIYTLPELRYPVRLNVARELLDRNLDLGHAERPALRVKGMVLSYAELARRVNRLGNGLRGTGIEPGDRVLMRFGNGPEFIITWLALQKLGAITVSSMPMLRARELSYIANDAGAGAAVVGAPLREELDKIRMQVKSLRQVIVAGGARPGDIAWEGLFEGQPERLEALDTGADDVAMIAYTSGSTGVPKGCVHVHRDILASADSYARSILAPSPEDVFGGHPTLAFTFGTGGLMVFPFRFGACTALMGPFTPELMLETIVHHRISVLFCAPTSYKLMLLVPEMERRYDLKPLRLCVSAAEPLPAATYEEWVRRAGAEVLDGIGATEMFHIFISSVKGRVRPGATGVPVPGYDCRVVDEAGNELPPGQPGPLAIRGPTGCKYWRNPGRQGDYVKKGWNYPGDVYVRDADGYFWFQCRSDDMIVSGGYKIPGPEVERVLDEHPAVAECAVVGSPDETRGFVTKAFIVLRPGVSPSVGLAAELQEYVKRELAPYKYPRRIEFVDALPRTETGKIRRVELRQLERDRAKQG